MKMEQKIFILGGYGTVGRSIANHLLAESTAKLIIAGRNGEKAEKLASQLNQTYPGGRVEARTCDFSNASSLTQALADTNLFVLSAPASRHIATVTDAILKTGVDYLDLLWQKSVYNHLKSIEPQIISAGSRFITHAGLNPGMAFPLAREAAAAIDSCQHVRLGLLVNFEAKDPHDFYDIFDHLGETSNKVFQNGQWHQARKADIQILDFGPPHQKKQCVPLFMEDQHSIPHLLHLEEYGLYAANAANRFLNFFVYPLTFWARCIHPGLGRNQLLGKLFVWGTRFNSRPREVVLFAEGTTQMEKSRVTIRLANSHELTAICVSACILQYLHGKINKNGLQTMGECVDSSLLLEDISRMGVHVERIKGTANFV